MTCKPHFIFIGFKNTGKSTLGKLFAEKKNLPFIDLDHVVEKMTLKSCRRMIEDHGENYFRKLEAAALHKSIKTTPSVIALGGGALLCLENQLLIKPHCVIHVTAPRKIVFDRIMQNGVPAFFSAHESTWETFNRLWDTRETVYQQLSNITVSNDAILENVIQQIIKNLGEKC
jgi:shikimate kinase